MKLRLQHLDAGTRVRLTERHRTRPLICCQPLLEAPPPHPGPVLPPMDESLPWKSTKGKVQEESRAWRGSTGPHTGPTPVISHPDALFGVSVASV